MADTESRNRIFLAVVPLLVLSLAAASMGVLYSLRAEQRSGELVLTPAQPPISTTSGSAPERTAAETEAGFAPPDNHLRSKRHAAAQPSRCVQIDRFT